MNFKQFFNLLRQQRLFSGIYVTCTALSTALTLTLFLVVYIMVGPVYPEQNRGRLAVVRRVLYESAEENGGNSRSPANMKLADSLRTMPEVELVTAIQQGWAETVADAGGKNFTCISKQVDDAYWQVFDFRFTHGRGFTREEWEAQSPVCVISEGMARRVFGRTDVVDQMLSVGGTSAYNPNHKNRQLRVVGVVEDASMATPLTCAQFWRPATYDGGYDDEVPFLGYSKLVILLREGKTVAQLQARVARMEERINQEMAAAKRRYRLRLHGQPQPHWQSCFAHDTAEDWKPALRKILGLLLAFLLIPAMNMSSMVASRINARISELGIRRAYGAGRGTLLWQVLQENFLLTLIGSVAGLAISWLILTLGADRLIYIFNEEGRQLMNLAKTPVQLNADMLLSGWVVVAVIAATLVLNLISALIPTLWILHRPVTEEINSKR